jgi:serine/threonine protein kinase
MRYLEQQPAGNLISDVLSNGHQLGHYKIVSKIGSGGMGDVYLAEDGKLGRHVADHTPPGNIY